VAIAVVCGFYSSSSSSPLESLSAVLLGSAPAPPLPSSSPPSPPLFSPPSYLSSPSSSFLLSYL